MPLNFTAFYRLAYLTITVVFFLYFGWGLSQTKNMGIGGIFVAIFLSVLLLSVLIAYYYNKLYLKIQDNYFETIGLIPSKYVDDFKTYYIGSHGEVNLTGTYQSTNESFPFTVIRFTLIRGSQKSKRYYNFIGFEFITNQDHYPVQVRRRVTPIAPLQLQKVQLESSEFNELFSVYAADPKAPYYFFDPDTMSDLIDVRTQLGTPFNIDVAGNKILIFLSVDDVNKIFFGKPSVLEVLNNQPNPNRLAFYQTATSNLLLALNKVFATLDFKLKK